jgi:hypothetical protein
MLHTTLQVALGELPESSPVLNPEFINLDLSQVVVRRPVMAPYCAPSVKEEGPTHGWSNVTCFSSSSEEDTSLIL